MKYKILSISGWGQKPNSLDYIFKSQKFANYSSSFLDYSKFDNANSFFDDVKKLDLNPDILVGWSLGGQLCLRLIEAKIIAPKYLILIAPPFQMVKNSRIQAAMSVDSFEEFYTDFKRHPDFVLKKFAILTAMNDKNSKEIAKNLEISDKNLKNLVFWLEELKRFSFFDFDFSKMPKTLFFQGKGDMIVHKMQSLYFKDRIKNMKLCIFNNCGHAPHISDFDKFCDEFLCFIEEEY